MKTHDRIFYMLSSILGLFLLSGCSYFEEQSVSNQKSESTSESVEKESNTSSTQKSTVSSDKNMVAMDFEQIVTGDFSSIAGTWYEVAYGNNHVLGEEGTQYEIGENRPISVTSQKIDAVNMTVEGKTLTDNIGDHELKFTEKDGHLYASLVDQTVAINWSISFYPVGTTNAFSTDTKSEMNTQNLIVIWSSNMNQTRVFSEQPITKNILVKDINLNELSQNNFSSLVGIWKNPTSGDVLEVTSEIMDKPEESRVVSDLGAIIKNKTTNEYPMVIINGQVRDGYMLGGIGTFHPEAVMSPFAPMAIVPKNIKMADADDSDSTRDRLISGGGQSGFESQAYYRD